MIKSRLIKTRSSFQKNNKEFTMDDPTPEPIENESLTSLESETLEQGQFVKEIIGDNIQLERSFTVSANAQGNLDLSNSFAAIARAEGDMHVQDSGAMTIVAGGDMQVTNGGAQFIITGGNSQISSGGAQIMVVGGEMTAQQTFVGLAITNQLNLSEDSKVLLDKPQALLFGAAFGAIFAFFTWLLRRRG
jgi:hypothetical protein